MASAFPITESGRRGRTCRARRCSTAMAGSPVSMTPGYLGGIGKTWLERAMSGWWPISAAAASSGPPGTRRACGRASACRMTISPPSPATSRSAASPRRHSAAYGGSNGGLLVGNMLTRFPDLFGAIWCAVPLLDMRRYTRLLAGPSWVAEYGDPDSPETGPIWRDFRRTRTWRRGEATRPCSSSPRDGTTGFILAMPARWRRG